MVWSGGWSLAPKIALAPPADRPVGARHATTAASGCARGRIGVLFFIGTYFD